MSRKYTFFNVFYNISFPTQDEAASEGNRTVVSGQSNCKKNKVREVDSSGTSRTCPNSRNSGASEDAFVSGHQMDDAKSDTSLWEVVKTDDIEGLERGSPDRDDSQAIISQVNSVISGSNKNTASNEIFDWNKDKARELNKISSTGSDTSGSNDGGQASLELTYPRTSLSPTDLNKSISTEVTSPDASLQPLKRKRGRPSKASLLRERELKKLREQEKLNADQVPSANVKSDVNLKVESVKDHDVMKVSRKELETLSDSHPSIMIPEFIPVDREGVTEVVLDDPDFGSMKFTLSVVGIDSPLSSSMLGDNFKCHSYASSSGNLSSDSLTREDFEGFETPVHSSFMDVVPKDVIDSLADDISESRSQVDLGLTYADNMITSKHKCNTSDSAELKANSSFTDEDVSIVDHEESKNDTSYFPSCAQTAQSVSRSFESLLSIEDSSKQHHEPMDDRNAYSDGELSESPKKRCRRKSMITQEHTHSTSGSDIGIQENP